jgi:hypothetical protein
VFPSAGERTLPLQIWRTHKLVCGTNPLLWPPFTKQEADEIWNLRNESLGTEEAYTFLTHMQAGATGTQLAGATLSQVETVFKVSAFLVLF